MSTKLISAKEKAPYTASFVEDLFENGSGPIVIFSEHVPSVCILVELLSKKYRVGKVTGAIKVEERAKIVRDFQANKLDFIVMTIGAGATGYDLYNSSTLVFNDESSKPSANEQAIGRIYRSGQKNKCIVYKIYGSDIDKHITKLIQEKNKVIKEAT